MSWQPCTHKTMIDFVENPVTVPRVWICSVCGKKDYWGPMWIYHGNIECKICWTARIDFVMCSDECKAKMKRRRNDR